MLARWSEYLRRELRSAENVDTRTLLDTLPSWVDAVVDALVTAKPNRDLLQTTAREHGEHRATALREYTVRDLVTEYNILRRVVFETLEVEGPLAPADREFVMKLFEDDVLNAISGFLQVHAARSQGLVAKAEEAGDLLGTMLADSQDGVAAIDHAWRFIYLNREAARMLSGGQHTDVTQLLGKYIWDAGLTGVGPKLFWAQLEALERREPVTFTEQFAALDANVQVRVHPTDAGLTVYFRDVTANTRCQTTLAASDARFHYMVEAIKDYAMFMLDPNGVVTSWNLGAERLKQYKAEEIIGTHFRRLYLPEDAAAGRPEANLRKAMIKGRTEDEWWRRRKDGSCFWANVVITTMFDDHGALVGYAKVIRDLTERKHAEEDHQTLSDVLSALAVSLDYDHVLDELTRLLVPARADWCLLEVKPDNRPASYRIAHKDPAKTAVVEELNQRFRPFLELPDGPAKVLRTGNRIFVPSTDEAALLGFAVDARHGELLRSAGIGGYMSLPLSARGRTLGTVTLVSGEPGSFGARQLALTEELVRRAALFIDNALLYEDARKAVDMREVLAVVSHDLREPLSSIATNAQLLGKLVDQDSNIAGIHPHVSRIARASDRMARLINDLLDLSRIEVGKLTLNESTFPARDLVNEIVEMFRPGAAEKDVDLTTNIQEGALELTADRDRLAQVLTNIVANAIKFTPAGGSVTVGLRHEGRGAELWVKDTGGGIAPEDLTHIFDRFWQSKDSSGLGTGLGLSIARALVELHGGTISAESTLDEGATFRVLLPRSIVAVEAPAAANQKN